MEKSTLIKSWAKESESSSCGGMNACLDRKYDETKEDCKQCFKDATDAMADKNV